MRKIDLNIKRSTSTYAIGYLSPTTMYLVGLTGGIASGKSTVAQMFRDLGVTVLDADAYSREVVLPGTRAYKKIHREFGTEVFKEDGTLDRQRLGRIIFADREKRKKLNKIVHPEVYKAMMWRTLKEFFNCQRFIVLDVPLLFESGVLVSWMHKIIVVSCEPGQQLSRLCSRDAIDDDMALQRIHSQIPIEEKASKANFVIDNSGDPSETKEQVRKVVELLKEDKFYQTVRFLIAAMSMFIVGSLYIFFIS